MVLKLKFSSDQEHQTEAVESVCNLFRGQEFMDARFTAEAGGEDTLFGEIGHANGIHLSAAQLE